MKPQSVYIHPSSIVSEQAELDEGTKVWHFCHIMEDVNIGKHCSFGQNTFIASGVQIGNQVKVQNNVSIYSGVLLEDYVFIGPSVVFTNVINPRSEINRSGEFKPTLIQKGASIGANATIICGRTIGKYALIGAGAVVTKDIPDHALIVGNPGVQTGWVSKAGHTLQFNQQNRAICPESGEIYALDQNKIYIQ